MRFQWKRATFGFSYKDGLTRREFDKQWQDKSTQPEFQDSL